MKMRTSIKLIMLTGGISVKKNDGTGDVKWNGKFRVFNGKEGIVIEWVILNRNTIELKLVLIEEGA